MKHARRDVLRGMQRCRRSVHLSSIPYLFALHCAFQHKHTTQHNATKPTQHTHTHTHTHTHFSYALLLLRYFAAYLRISKDLLHFPSPPFHFHGAQEEYAEVDDDGTPGTAAAAAPAASKGVSPTQKPFGRSKSEHPQAEKKLLSSWLSPTGKSVVKQSAAGGSLLTVDGHVQRRTASARPGNASPAFKRALAFVGGMKPTDLIQTAKSSDGN